MIVSFGNRETEALFHGRRGAKAQAFGPEVSKIAVRKLDMLNAAESLRDLASPPGNRLEALTGNLRGFHGIRINDQWRIIFRWRDGFALNVAIVDYH